MNNTKRQQADALKQAMYVLQGLSFKDTQITTALEAIHRALIEDTSPAQPALTDIDEVGRPEQWEQSETPELGDRFMEILRSIHGDMPDAFADSARLAYVQAMHEPTTEPAVLSEETIRAIIERECGPVQRISEMRFAIDVARATEKAIRGINLNKTLPEPVSLKGMDFTQANEFVRLWIEEFRKPALADGYTPLSLEQIDEIPFDFPLPKGMHETTALIEALRKFARDVERAVRGKT